MTSLLLLRVSHFITRSMFFCSSTLISFINRYRAICVLCCYWIFTTHCLHSIIYFTASNFDGLYGLSFFCYYYNYYRCNGGTAQDYFFILQVLSLLTIVLWEQGCVELGSWWRKGGEMVFLVLFTFAVVHSLGSLLSGKDLFL